MEVNEIPLLGRKYTWSNERQPPTLVRLDRAFYCVEWDSIFPKSILQSMTAGVSEHCPLILDLKVDTASKRWVHLESFWTRCLAFKFQETVKQNWEAPVQSDCAVERLFLKLQRFSKGLQKWGQEGEASNSNENWPRKSSIA